jgi:hypothetical protein
MIRMIKYRNKIQRKKKQPNKIFIKINYSRHWEPENSQNRTKTGHKQDKNRA